MRDPTPIRPATQAGRFYPAHPAVLRRDIEEFLNHAHPPAGLSPKALIAPHAGYVYSGPIAASAYATWIPDRDRIHQVILLGPSHWADFSGLAAPSAPAFSTPLGTVPVATDTLDRCLDLPEVVPLDDAHRPEHALEVQIPFLQVVLANFTLVPLLVGKATTDTVATVLDHLWNGDSTRIAISSDLSHYLDYPAARQRDAATADRILQLDADALSSHDACGYRAIRGLLRLAAQHHLTPRLLDLRNSGDTAGGRDRVVGYGAFAFA